MNNNHNMNSKQTQDNVKLTIATINTRSLNDYKIRKVEEKLLKFKIDILLLQETHKPTISREENMKKRWGMCLYNSSGTESSRGVIIAVKESNTIKVKDDTLLTTDSESGDAAAIEIEWNNKTYTILNTYGKRTPAARKAQFENILYDSLEWENPIWGADYNMVENAALDIDGRKAKTEYKPTDQGLNELEDVKKYHKLKDPFREKFPNERQFTFRGQKDYRARLDRIYVPEEMCPEMSSYAIEPLIDSDHDMFILTFNEPKTENRTIGGKDENKKKKTLWKYNCKLLEKKSNLDEFEKFWNNWVKMNKNITQTHQYSGNIQKIKYECGFSTKAKKKNEQTEKLKPI